MRKCKDGCFLALKIPANNQNSPLVAEQILSAIHGRKIPCSFEIWSSDNYMQFAIYCRKQDKSFFIYQLESHYPGIYIEEEIDKAQKLTNINSAYLGFTAAPIFPLRRYSQSSDKIKRRWLDPYQTILPTLKVHKEEMRAVQIIIEAESNVWRKRGQDTLDVSNVFSSYWIFRRFWNFKDWFIKVIYYCWPLRILFLFMVYKRRKTPIEVQEEARIDHREHSWESAYRAARSKLSQSGFLVSIRFIYQGDLLDVRSIFEEMACGFQQFNIPELNGFKIRKIYKNKSTKCISKRTTKYPMLLSLEELAGILMLPTKETKMPELVQTQFKIIPANKYLKNTKGIAIGKALQEGERALRFSQRDFANHIGIFGQTGAGKSTFLLRFILELIKKNQGIGILDPHGDLAEALLAMIPLNRIKDTVLIDPVDSHYPIAFNVLKISACHKDKITATTIDIFKKLYSDSWGPRSEYILANIVSLLVCHPKASLLGIPKVLFSAHYRKECLQYVDNPIVHQFWQEEFKAMPARLRVEATSPILNKVNRFLMVPMIRNILAQKENLLDLKEIINNRQILIINLPKGILGETNSALLGNFLLSHLQLAALSRAEQKPEDRTDYILCVDELPHFLSISSSHIKTILSESRKYALYLTFVCQYISQLGNLKETLFGNINTFVSFGLGYTDAREIAQYLKDISADDLINLPPHHGYVRFVRENTPHAISLKTFPPNEQENKQIKRLVRENSRKRYARDKKEVEKEITKLFEFPIP